MGIKEKTCIAQPSRSGGTGGLQSGNEQNRDRNNSRSTKRIFEWQRDIERCNPLTLPSLLLNRVQELPQKIVGIYFLIDEDDSILYVGQSKNIRQRLMGKHHRASALKNKNVRVAWLELSDKQLLSAVENALIAWFNPTLNEANRQLLGGDSAGERFYRLRITVGLSQVELADAIGVTDQTVSNWERGVHVPKLTPRQMANLCKTTNRSIDEIADLLEP